MQEGPRWIVGDFGREERCREFCLDRRIPKQWCRGQQLLVKVRAERSGTMGSLLCAGENCDCRVYCIEAGDILTFLDWSEVWAINRFYRGADPVTPMGRLIAAIRALTSRRPPLKLAEPVRCLLPTAMRVLATVADAHQINSSHGIMSGRCFNRLSVIH